MLIDPVGILRTHQREVRRKSTMTTKTSTTRMDGKMRTLDKIWENTQTEDEDKMMIDEKTKTGEKTMNDIMHNDKKKKNANDDKETQTKHNSYEFSVRIKIKADNIETAAQHHKQIMYRIAKETNHFKIYSQTNKMIGPDEMRQDSFEYHQVGKHTKFFIVVHGLETNIPYHQIKKNEQIFTSLKKYSCYMQKHLWPEKEWNIVTIGYLSGVSPKHQAKDIVKQTFKHTKNTELKYELGAKNIQVDINGTNTTTLVYEVRCKDTDVEEVCNYITTTGQDLEITLIKHKWKYTHHNVYVNGIRKQNDFIDKIRTVPIYGITNDVMNHLYSELTSKETILDVSATSKTREFGRWNVYTTMDKFETTTKWLENNLQDIYNECLKDMKSEETIPDHFVPEVKFNTNIKFGTSPDPHLEIATSSVHSYSSYPTNSWASVVKGYHNYKPKAQPTSHETSSISSISDFTKTLQTINDSIERICKRLDNIEDRLNQQDEFIQHMTQFEENTHAHMERLTDMLDKLEERTTRIAPRRLDHSFDIESNKRQDTRSSPRKGNTRV